jgi:hypothetical protein
MACAQHMTERLPYFGPRFDVCAMSVMQQAAGAGCLPATQRNIYLKYRQFLPN